MMHSNDHSPVSKNLISYLPDEAPFGGLNLIRADQALRGPLSDEVIGLEGAARTLPPSITKNAWMESGWLHDDLRSHPGAYEQFKSDKPLKQPYGIALSEVMVNAARRLSKQTGWLAVESPENDRQMNSKHPSIGAYVFTSEVVGFSDGRIDISGSAVERAVKRVRYPEKVYAAVSNVNVLKRRQASYVGTALLYATLGSFPAKKRTTMYASASNDGLIKKLEELGYAVTGSQPRDDLVTNATIEEVRLQAPSVASVRQALKEQHQWLK